MITDHMSGLVEVHPERLQVNDRGLMAISRCAGLKALHLVKKNSRVHERWDCLIAMSLSPLVSNCHGLGEVDTLRQ